MLKNFKNRLELLKKKNNLRGADLAKAGNISPQSVSAYNDSTLPRAEVLAGWHDKLSLNINWLLTGEGEMLRHQKDVTDATTSLAEMEEHKGELKQRYAENLEELNALKTEFIDLQKELLCIHRGRRQDQRTHEGAPTLALGGDSVAP